MNHVTKHPDGSVCIYTSLPLISPNDISRTVPLEMLIQMSQRENFLRLHDDAYQQKFKASYGLIVEAGAGAGEDKNEPPALNSVDIVEEMQLQVLKEFGYEPDDVLALYELRTAAMQYPDVKEFQETVYFRYNRAGDSDLVRVGEVGPNTTIYTFPQNEQNDDVGEPRRSLTDGLEKTTLHDALSRRYPQDVSTDSGASAPPAWKHFPRVVVSGSYT